jgi:hypothetical protein
MTALAAFLLWQFLTVHYNRGGNWTALFLTGQSLGIPPELAPGTYCFPGDGYDGEMYRYVAHDLFMQRGYARYIDSPPLRYRRLLIPGLAYLLAAGRQPAIDASYIAVVALFVFLGAYWLSRWAALEGARPAWALAFLLVPATLISMDRMTVDIAIAAFTAACAVYWRTGSWRKLYIVLLLACLAHETGLLLAGGMCLYELAARRFWRAVFWASATLPLFLWSWLLGRIFHTTSYGVERRFAGGVGLGLFHPMFQPPRYPLPPLLEDIARFADVLALACVLLALILAVAPVLRGRPKEPLVFCGLLFALLVLILPNSDVWTDVNGYARVFSPLLLLVALPSIAGKTWVAVPWWIGLVPTIGVDLRLGVQFASSVGGVLRGLF